MIQKNIYSSLLLGLLLAGCSSYNAPIIVDSNSRQIISPPVEQERSAFPVTTESYTAITQEAHSYNSYGEFNSSPDVRAHYADGRSSGWMQSRTRNQNEHSTSQHYSDSNSETLFSSADLSSRLRDIRSVTRTLSPALYRGRQGEFNSMRQNSRGHSAYGNEHVSRSIQYAPHKGSASVVYINAMIVSVTKAPDKCELYPTGDQHQGALTPSYMDTRSAIGQQAHRNLYAQGSQSYGSDCSDGGYSVTYVYQHPSTGQTMSGLLTMDQPPERNLVRLPLSL